MPSLFNLGKRSSTKGLHSSEESNDSRPSAPRSSTEPPPSLPSPKTPDSSLGRGDTVGPHHATRSFSSPLLESPVASSPPWMPNNPGFPRDDADGGEITSSKEQLVFGPLSPMNRTVTQELTLEAQLSEAWKQTSQSSKGPKADEVREIVEESAQNIREHESNSDGIIAGVGAAIKELVPEDIEEGVSKFLEGSTVLMNALDEVAKLHPFVGVAVMAFKTVWTLEMKRRENDKKIIALYVEMKEMMTVLLQLKTVKDAEAVAPDNTTIKDRMQGLIKTTADDIKTCANTCDTYSKKKLVVKILKGPLWEPKLLQYVKTFTKRREQFEFALSIHTALGVDAANRALEGVKTTTQDINAKMELMMRMFQTFMSPEEKEIVRRVDVKGGPKAVQDDDKLLKELIELEPKATPLVAAHGTRWSGKPGVNVKSSDFQDLKTDLRTDPDEAIEKNMAIYSRKFEIQKRQIIDELSRVIRREGDRMIDAVTSGWHDKIIDPDVHKMWKGMNWKGSVKARHFVLALRDYFHEKWYNIDPSAKGDSHDVLTKDRESDEWALAYLNVIRLQPVSEAFDDDASGFITVAEVNAFTTSRPRSWSLPHWIAYWAIGWHQSMVDYALEIRELISKMFTILPHIQPANSSSVHQYLETVYVPIMTIQESLNACDAKDTLRIRFKSYVEAEEARLKANLEEVNYDIDAMDTLVLITGPGRIEKFLLPLIYLILKRHFEIFRVCQTKAIHPDELWDCADTLAWVFDAISDRITTLQTIFKGQKLDLKHQFKNFAHGLFEYMNDPGELWSPAHVKESEYPTDPYEDEKEDQTVDIDKLLNHLPEKEELDFAAYEVLSQDDESAAVASISSTPYDAILGTWYALLYWLPSSNHRSAGLAQYVFRPSATDTSGRRFEASGGFSVAEFSISGQCSPGETPDVVNISFKRSFPARFPPQYFKGQWNAATDSITGKWGLDPDEDTHVALFILKRTATPQNLRFLPAPVIFEDNKPRALWSFALSVIYDTVRRQSWSRLYFKERRDNRKRFIELYIRRTKYGKPLDPAELEELGKIGDTFTVADSRFYHSLAQYKIRRIIGHNEVHCDACGGRIGGARLICMVCQTKETFNTIDLCERPECISAPIERDDMVRSHRPTHDLMKVRRVVHQRNFGALDRAAKAALQRARGAFESVDPNSMSENMEDPNEVYEAEQGLAFYLTETGPICGVCKTPVTQPCWYCVQCPNVFICNNCDFEGPKPFDDHQVTHDLVRCQEFVEDEEEVPMEVRLSRLEKLFDDQGVAINERFHQLETKVDERLSRLETLLESLIDLTSQKLGSIQQNNQL